MTTYYEIVAKVEYGWSQYIVVRDRPDRGLTLEELREEFPNSIISVVI